MVFPWPGVFRAVGICLGLLMARSRTRATPALPEFPVPSVVAAPMSPALGQAGVALGPGAGWQSHSQPLGFNFFGLVPTGSDCHPCWVISVSLDTQHSPWGLIHCWVPFPGQGCDFWFGFCPDPASALGVTGCVCVCDIGAMFLPLMRGDTAPPSHPQPHSFITAQPELPFPVPNLSSLWARSR